MKTSERACQIWSVLAWVARNRQTLTYADLGKLIGVPPAGLGNLLEPIQSYCILEKLPPLTVLVVKTDNGLPGSGFTGATANEFGSALAAVYGKDWLAHGNPQSEKLDAAVKSLPSNGTIA